MSEEMTVDVEALQKRNAELEKQLARQKKLATRALANYQQRALQMEIIRQLLRRYLMVQLFQGPHLFKLLVCHLQQIMIFIYSLTVVVVI